MTLKDCHVTVYVTGGIAVYKAASVVRGLMKQGALVRVAMTAAATEFVTPLTFATLTKQPVITDLFRADNTAYVPHIELADWTELAVIVPATANIVAKLATGIADDVVTSALLATTAPVIVVPAMNEHMWTAAATQRNLATLQSDGRIIMEPATGMLAEGYAGHGRLPEPDQIVAFVQTYWAKQTGTLVGRKLLITAGGTKERIDPVRFISNDSSGKMGYALAAAAADQGATVTLVSTVNLPVPAGVTVVSVTDAREMLAAIQQEFADLDVLIMAAAIADFRPAQVADQKIKKTIDNDEMTLALVKNPDILKTLAQTKDHQLMVGFAAETQNLLVNAQQKLTNKRLDMLIANDVARADSGFGVDTNQVTILQPGRDPEPLPTLAKTVLAQQIIEMITAKLK